MGVDLNIEENEHGYTPLTLSLVFGHEWAAIELLKAGKQLLLFHSFPFPHHTIAGAKVRVAARNGRTPMFVAAEKGLSEVIRIMINECGVDINEPVVLPSGLRLLHVAAFHKQPQIVSLLISMGAAIDVLDDEGGYNPLTMAIIGSNVSAALELINAGANLNIVSQAGRSPMYVAIEKGLTEVVRVLVEKRKVDINAATTREARYLFVNLFTNTNSLNHSRIPIVLRSPSTLQYYTIKVI